MIRNPTMSGNSELLSELKVDLGSVSHMGIIIYVIRLNLKRKPDQIGRKV